MICKKRIKLKFCTFLDAYGHFHISTQINDLTGPSWKEKSLQRKKFANIQLKENLQGFFDSAFVTTATKIKARQNLPSEGPGTGLANPSIHLDAVLAKLHYVN